MTSKFDADRTTVSVNVVSVEEYDGGKAWPARYATKLVDVVEWFKSALLEVPERFRHEATCKISSSISYDSSEANITIDYCRPETDNEVADRLARDAANEAHKRNAELAALRALKAKYPHAD